MNDYDALLPALTAGLRRYLDAPGLRVLKIRTMPRPPVLPGLQCEQRGLYQYDSLLIDLKLHENEYPLGFMLRRGDIETEYYLHRYLAMHLPILVPGMVAGEPRHNYLILERQDDLRPPTDWLVDDYRQAADNLALLHDRFWGLEEDLDNFKGLARPMDRDYQAIKATVQAAVSHLNGDHPPHARLDTPPHKKLFHTLLHYLDALWEPLHHQTFTLLHGDYWNDNLAVPLDGGRQIITTWDQAAIGPALLDVVWFHQQIEAHYAPEMPAEATIARYRAQMDRRMWSLVWSNEVWAQMWDYALMWNVAVRWLPWLATCTPDQYAPQHDALHQGWINPALNLIEQYFGMEP